MLRFHCFFGLILCTALALPGVASAESGGFRTGLAGGMMDSGDGRFRPAVGVEVGMPDYASLRYFAYGHRAGIVSQFGSAASLGREWFLTQEVLRARAGFAYLREQTQIRQDGAATLKSTSQNIGLAFGFRLHKTLGSSFIALDWQNNCYVSGEKAILASFGRRQFLNLELGVAL
jgi:hypothetical protein